MNFHSKIFLASILLFAFSCVEPFQIDVKDTLEVVLVEASLSDEDIPQKINISNSTYFNETAHSVEIESLKVEVLVNSKKLIALTDEGNGVYGFPIDFRAKADDSFQLFFQKPDGRKYLSAVEKLVNSPQIEKIYDVFEKEGTTAFGRIAPSNNIYIDFIDSDLSSNYYSWSWTLWERQNICLSTDYYDLYCNHECYEILYNDDISIMSDGFYNGKKVESKQIAKIPYYQYGGALIQIRQEAISFEAFKFYKGLQDLAQNTGTLAETPPQIIGGNIKCTSNPKEIVVGMFMVKGQSSKYFWLSRENAQGKAIPISLIGRKPISSSGGVTAPCISGRNRTPNRPKNWIG